jgi:hypothetical protein
MRFNIDKLIRKSIRLLGTPIDYQKHALEVITLSEAHRNDVTPSIYLPGHFDRIFSTNTSTDLTIPYQHAHQTEAIHAPTLLCNIGAVRLWNGAIFQNYKNYLLRRVDCKEQFEDIDLDNAFIADTDEGHEFFGHWLRDDVAATLISKDNMPAIFHKTLIKLRVIWS